MATTVVQLKASIVSLLLPPSLPPLLSLPLSFSLSLSPFFCKARCTLCVCEVFALREVGVLRFGLVRTPFLERCQCCVNLKTRSNHASSTWHIRHCFYYKRLLVVNSKKQERFAIHLSQSNHRIQGELPWVILCV